MALREEMANILLGQPQAIEAVVPYVEAWQAGMHPPDRPAGVFLGLGPTGVGKTRTVEALADVLHGDRKALLRIDCAEFQMEHEVAKLIGAPPGYLGHRETQPMINQHKLVKVTTEKCGLSLVLFDEIEKAAGSLKRLLLGVLDRGVLGLGDNSKVSFENSLVFMTSNLGAQAIQRGLTNPFGFTGGAPTDIKKAGLSAVRKHFAPEFVNRIDEVITYNPLGRDIVAEILDKQLGEMQDFIDKRRGPERFFVKVSKKARKWLTDKGFTPEYGARELKRVVQRYVAQPIAGLVAGGKVPLGSMVVVSLKDDKLAFRVAEPKAEKSVAAGSDWTALPALGGDE